VGTPAFKRPQLERIAGFLLSWSVDLTIELRIRNHLSAFDDDAQGIFRSRIGLPEVNRVKWRDEKSGAYTAARDEI
jgi:hypothetical protein